jgi:hypothetical protein
MATVEEKVSLVDGLRALADALEEHPGHPWRDARVARHVSDFAEWERWCEAFGLELQSRPHASYEVAFRTVGGVELALQTDSPREDAQRERLLAERERQLERREGEVAMREAALADV